MFCIRYKGFVLGTKFISARTPDTWVMATTVFVYKSLIKIRDTKQYQRVVTNLGDSLKTPTLKMSTLKLSTCQNVDIEIVDMSKCRHLKNSTCQNVDMSKC